MIIITIQDTTEVLLNNDTHWSAQKYLKLLEYGAGAENISKNTRGTVI